MHSHGVVEKNTEVLFLLSGRLRGGDSGRHQRKVERWISSQPLEREAPEPLQLPAAMPCTADPPRAYRTHYGPAVSHRGYSRALPGASARLSVRSCRAQLAGLALLHPPGNNEGTLSAAPGHRSCPGALAVSQRQAHSSGHRGRDALQGPRGLVCPVPAGPLRIHGAGHLEELVRSVQGNEAILPNKGDGCGHCGMCSSTALPGGLPPQPSIFSHLVYRMQEHPHLQQDVEFTVLQHWHFRGD